MVDEVTEEQRKIGSNFRFFFFFPSKKTKFSIIQIIAKRLVQLVVCFLANQNRGYYKLSFCFLFFRPTATTRPIVLAFYEIGFEYLLAQQA